jgi:NAD(P)-dependent dehydrogenase (short-subunit alcohol dehydrogenase family)
MQMAIHSGFDKQSTADDVLAGIDLSSSLAVVTGSNGGIGKETARALAVAGADVVITGRDKAALAAARAEIADQAPGRSVHAIDLDLMSLNSVDKLADAVLALGRPLNMLINNAGTVGPLIRNEAGLESQLMINVIGHAVLAHRLAPALTKAGQARIVMLTSLGHQYCPALVDDLNFKRTEYSTWRSYGSSKSASSLLALHFSKVLGHSGVRAFAVHPGAIWTNMGRALTPEDYESFAEMSPGGGMEEEAFKSVGAGAATSVWAATSPQLAEAPALYLEDCGVAPIIEQPNYRFGVMRHALDEDAADRLWPAIEKLVGRSLPLCI